MFRGQGGRKDIPGHAQRQLAVLQEWSGRWGEVKVGERIEGDQQGQHCLK